MIGGGRVIESFERKLLEQYAPCLQYDAQDAYRAVSAATMTDAGCGALLRADGSPIAGDGSFHGLGLEVLADYPGSLTFAEGDHLAAGPYPLQDAVRLQRDPAYPHCCFGRVLRPVRPNADEGEDGPAWLQYWIWYHHNPKTFLGKGSHEGDWELVQVGLGAHGRPAHLTLSQHGFGEARRWGSVELEASHPVVFVAPFSHANYFEARTHFYFPAADHPTRNGPRRVPRVEQFGSWRAWEGRWGASRGVFGGRLGNLGGQSPPAPIRQRVRWGRPAAFHARAVARKPLSLIKRALWWVGKRTFPCPPTLQGERLVGTVAEIRYELDQRLLRRSRHLLLTAHTSDEREDVLVSRVVRDVAARGTERLVLPGEPPRCIVYASAFNVFGQRSDADRTELAATSQGPRTDGLESGEAPSATVRPATTDGPAGTDEPERTNEPAGTDDPAGTVEPRHASAERLIRGSLLAFLAVDALLLGVWLLAALGYLVDALEGTPQFPLITNSVGVYVLLLCATALALADVRRFRAMLLLIAGAHALQVAGLVLMVALHGLSGDLSILQLFDLPAAVVFGLWAAYALAVTALFAVLYTRAPAPEVPLPSERDVGWQQVVLRAALGAMALVFSAFVVLYVVRGIEQRADFVFVAASVSKDGLFLAFALLALVRPARWASLTMVVVVGHFALVASNALLWSSVSGPAPVFGPDPPFGGDGVDVVRNWMAIDVGVNLILIGALCAYQRARYRLDYLWPPAVRALEAFADALFANVPAEVSPRSVAETVDDYLAAFRGRAKGRIQGALVLLYYLPILWRLAPFTALSREQRLKWAERRFDRVDMAAPWPVGVLRRLLRALIRGAQQFAYVGYYSQPGGWRGTGFQPFSERNGTPPAPVNAERPGLDVIEPWQVGGRELEADVVVVGSGAAGAIIAYRLAEAGRRVLVLERGRHVRPAQMTEDEMEMFAKLYSDGALQLSRDFEFQVAQGRCVGGSTTVNNAVCLEPSAPTKDDWSRRVPGLDRAKLDQAFEDVRRFLQVERQPDHVRTIAATKLAEGLARSDRKVERVAANIGGCLGCGYCNSGCAYGKKLSMLDTVLLWGQQRFGDRLRIVSECEARRVERRHGRARAVRCRLSDGRRVRVRAREKVVVSAGAIASSRLLQRSFIGGRQVGRGLTFNLRTAVAARFLESVDSWAGLQMTDAHRPTDATPWMIESWSVPVVSQALAMPGWFGDHERNMHDLRRIGWAGILVGAGTTGRVRRLPLPWDDSEFEFKPGWLDLMALKEAFQAAAEALFQAGAEEVMVSTHRRVSVSRDGADPKSAARGVRAELDRVVDDSSDMLNMGSSHPQGGNAMSAGRDSGVVDADCKVHGYHNLYVCDASVFPTSVTVNPQLTVMALAECAARGMVEAARTRPDSTPTPEATSGRSAAIDGSGPRSGRDGQQGATVATAPPSPLHERSELRRRGR